MMKLVGSEWASTVVAPNQSCLVSHADLLCVHQVRMQVCLVGRSIALVQHVQEPEQDAYCLLWLCVIKQVLLPFRMCLSCAACVQASPQLDITDPAWFTSLAIKAWLLPGIYHSWYIRAEWWTTMHGFSQLSQLYHTMIYHTMIYHTMIYDSRHDIS